MPDAFEPTPDALARADALRRQGFALEAVARELGAEGHQAPPGGWTPAEVARVLLRVSLARASAWVVELRRTRRRG